MAEKRPIKMLFIIVLLVSLSILMVVSSFLSEFSSLACQFPYLSIPVSTLELKISSQSENTLKISSQIEISSQSEDTKRKNNRVRKLYAKAKMDGALVLRDLEATLSSNTSFPYVSFLERNCPVNITLHAHDISKCGGNVKLPCGLAVGTSITIVGKTWIGFKLELKGSNERDAPTLYINSHLGNSSTRAMIEIKSGGFRKWWETPQLCQGWRLEQMVDGLVLCEAWTQGNKPSFPFKKGQNFILDLQVGLQGFHASIDGLHVASFPLKEWLSLEDVAHLYVHGSVELELIKIASLPLIHPPSSIERVRMLKAPSTPRTNVDLFIGIHSRSNNFDERRVIRNTWMQSHAARSTRVIIHFFVGLHKDLHVNLQLRKEADYFQDMIVLPFIDHYDFQAFKTIAILEHGVNVSTSHVMKIDDDTFVRVDALLDMIQRSKFLTNTYMGSIYKRVRSKDLQTTKWAISHEEWPVDDYLFPPYAQGGAGYVVSHDIAKFVASHSNDDILEIVRLEDIAMGMWVSEYNKSHLVQYVHNDAFASWGCSDEYITVHLRSTQQMQCLWNRIKEGDARCCA